jgi:cytochrome b subunit of formate dehydrogenase
MKTSLRRWPANLTAVTGWLLVRWLHVVSMAFFVGGQLFLAVAVVPVERRAPDRERLRAIARRFGWGSVIALVVLVITGSAMAGHFDDWGRRELSIKLALVVVIAGLVGWHLRRPASHALQGLVFLLSLVVVFLGLDLAH